MTGERRKGLGNGALTRPTLTTERLRLQPMTPRHLRLLHELDSDPEVLRFIIGRARTPAEIAEFWAPRCADTVADASGLGFWVGFAGDEFIGWWDLDPTASEPGAVLPPGVAEIGWRVRRARWGLGYATEGAEALLRHAFETLGLAAVIADTMAVNLASRAVMRKVGMHLDRTYSAHWHDPLPGADQGEVIYQITRDQWHSRHRSRP